MKYQLRRLDNQNQAKPKEIFDARATTPVEGLLVRLPEWRYPVVVDVAQGNLQYDNFEGRWGDPVHLNRLMQMYSVEKTKLEVHKKGWMVQETSLHNGSIQLQITQPA